MRRGQRVAGRPQLAHTSENRFRSRHCGMPPNGHRTIRRLSPPLIISSPCIGKTQHHIETCLCNKTATHAQQHPPDTAMEQRLSSAFNTLMWPSCQVQVSPEILNINIATLQAGASNVLACAIMALSAQQASMQFLFTSIFVTLSSLLHQMLFVPVLLVNVDKVTSSARKLRYTATMARIPISVVRIQ